MSPWDSGNLDSEFNLFKGLNSQAASRRLDCYDAQEDKIRLIVVAPDFATKLPYGFMELRSV